MSKQANPIELEMPSIVGPNLYELYTDADFYITRVYVNGVERKLSNAEGNGFRSKKGYELSGAMGYNNIAILNTHMRKGDNEIQVVFEPSPVITEMINKGATHVFIEDMHVRAVIMRGELERNGLGATSEKLDELLAKDHPGVEVLADNHVKDMAEEHINKPIIMTFTINVPEDEIRHKAQIHGCRGTINASYNFTANLLLNGTPILEIKDNTWTTLEPLYKTMQPLDNTLELQVLSINDTTKKSYLNYYIECDIKKSLINTGLESAYPYLRFGDFFDLLHLPLWNLTFEQEGTYIFNFEFYY